MVQSRATKNALHDLGYKIFLDRYAQKDMTRSTLEVGDTAIVVVNSQTGQREIGEITALDLPKVTIKLLDGETVVRDLEHVDKPIETQPEQMMERVASGVAETEKSTQKQVEWSSKFRWLLDDWKFVPGGRILTAAGTDQDLTYYNCMPPEQEILTKDGYMPIAEVQVGDYVVTHRNRLRKVLHKFERETEEDIYVIKPLKMGFDDLRVTGDHKVLLIRDRWVNSHRSRDGLHLSQEPQWIPAKELRNGDFVALAYNGDIQPSETIKISDYIGMDTLVEDSEYPEYAILSEHSAYDVEDDKLVKVRHYANGKKMIGKRPLPLNNELELDSALCYLFGRWLGDGCITHRTGTDIPSGIKIVFNLNEINDAKEIADIFESKFGISADIKLSSTERWYDLWVNSMPVGEFFRSLLGHYSYAKFIPSVLMNLPDNLAISLLRGLFQADGYTSKNQVGIVLSNRKLATQVHQLLMRLGYLFSIKENTHYLGTVPAYRVQATVSECADLFNKFFDVDAPENNTKLKYYFEYDNLRWVRIQTIETETYTGQVLDIEVDEDHSFVSAGVVVSNCYVIPSPNDSREGIMTTLTQMTEIMSRGGGVGINISTLRPRHAYVKGVNGRSSGAVSWGALYSFVTGLIEQGGCFGRDERIATDKGLIPAQELVERIEAGEEFYAHTHQGLRRIVDKFRNGVKPLYEVKTKRGYRVRITEDHKVAVLIDGQVVTMPLKYLQPDDEILTLLGDGIEKEYVQLAPVDYDRSVMSTTLNTDVSMPTELNEDLAYFLGYFHGDGYVHIGKKVNWQAPKGFKLATADSHPSIRQRLIDTLQSLFDVEPILEQGDGACANIVVYSRLLIEWMIQHGLLKDKSEKIRVPELIFRSPSSVMNAFIAGYFDADGCNRGRKGGYGIDSISYEMLEDVQQLLAISGIVSHITTQKRSGNWQDIHRLMVTGAPFRRRFAELIPAEKVSDKNGTRDMYNTYPAEVWHQLGARAKYGQRIYDGVSERISFNQLEKIQTRLIEAEETETAQQLADLMNVMPDQIESITLIGDQEVFDFEVEDVHLLSGNGIYTSNSRRGALMIILNDWHPDVFDFINSKRQAGQITNANISVGVSDKLMEAVKADGDWELVFPDTSDADYDELWDGDLTTWIASGRKVMPYKTVKARDLWNAIIESAWASAEPGVWFNERSNKMANSWYFNPLISTNPCIAGDMRIHTDEGLVQARELFDEETEISVAIDGRFGLEQHVTPATRVFMSGIKPVYRLQTKEGYYLRATRDHRIMTPRGWVELGDLNPGDKIHILNRKGGFGRDGSERLGRILGWLVGDGTIKADRAVLSFFGEEKKELAPMFAEYVNDIVEPLTERVGRTYTVGVVDIKDRDEARVRSQRLRTLVEEYGLVENKHQVPEVVFKGTEAMQRGFLQALFTADGSVQYFKEKKVASVRLACNHVEMLEDVQMLLANFGIASRIYKERRKAGYRNLPDGKGGLKSYWCEAQHELVISRSNMSVFRDEIGFILERKQEQLNDLLADYTQGPRAESFVAKVESIVEDGYEEVFDLTEPLSHSFVSQSIVISNCGEQPLGAFSVCNLGAINLSKFYDADKNDVKWDELRQTVRYATRFLDNVIDTTPYFFDENQVVQMNERRVGLGTMGIAELMLKLGIRYGSDESVDFIDNVYQLIATTAYEMSSDIAKEKGAFPKFDNEKFLESGFMQQMPETLREKIRSDGIRNVTLLTQAPTGTTGTMVNTSTGVEPFFSWVYYRKSRLGLHEEQVPIVQEWYDANPDAEELPDYFATAMDLAPEDHVKVQGAFQRWIDSAISKTCNVPNEYTVEQVSELYQYMYELGCKGGTIYRDGSRDEQVLMLKGDERAESEMQELKGDNKPAEKQTVAQATTPHRVYPRPDRLQGTTVRTETPFGKAYITINKDEKDNPFEVFITIGKVGSDIQADADSLGRMISLQLRTTAPHNRNEMLKLIIEQLQGIGGARPIGFGPKRVLSLPDAVANVLHNEFFKEEQPHQLGLPMNGDHDEADSSNLVENVSYSGADLCPDCGTTSLIRAEGCRKCLTCGYSEC